MHTTPPEGCAWFTFRADDPESVHKFLNLNKVPAGYVKSVQYCTDDGGWVVLFQYWVLYMDSESPDAWAFLDPLAYPTIPEFVPMPPVDDDPRVYWPDNWTPFSCCNPCGGEPDPGDYGVIPVVGAV